MSLLSRLLGEKTDFDAVEVMDYYLYLLKSALDTKHPFVLALKEVLPESNRAALLKTYSKEIKFLFLLYESVRLHLLIQGIDYSNSPVEITRAVNEYMSAFFAKYIVSSAPAISRNPLSMSPASIRMGTDSNGKKVKVNIEQAIKVRLTWIVLSYPDIVEKLFHDKSQEGIFISNCSALIEIVLKDPQKYFVSLKNKFPLQKPDLGHSIDIAA